MNNLVKFWLYFDETFIINIITLKELVFPLSIQNILYVERVASKIGKNDK